MSIELLRDIIKKNKFPITFEPDSPKGISIEEKFPKKSLEKYLHLAFITTLEEDQNLIPLYMDGCSRKNTKKMLS